MIREVSCVCSGSIIVFIMQMLNVQPVAMLNVMFCIVCSFFVMDAIYGGML